MFDNLYGELPLYVRVVLALVDYLLKAAANWRDTPEGAKEWSDFIDLYETSINSDEGRDVKIEPRSQARATPVEKQASQQARSRRRPAAPQPLPDDFDYSARD